ncbi:MAG: hypothetical protein KF768_13855 [Phycisphaeraceae bacterium]|nr:hypothetical protein [Phycisphaeraceae bacterium]
MSNANAATQLDVAVLEVPGDLTERQLFFSGDPGAFEYDDDGNMTSDGIWTYEWDGENRLKAMQMRPEIAEVRLAGTDLWVRLEFDYDWGGRRIAKRYLTATQSQVIAISDPIVREDWRSRVESAETEFMFFCQYEIHTRAYSKVLERVKKPLSKSITISDPETGECSPPYSTLAVVGFSWGGSAALELAHRLAADSVRVNLVFTVDPVHKFQETFTRFRKARTTDRLVNHYQTIGNNIVHGKPVAGADEEHHFPHPRSLHPLGSQATDDQLTALLESRLPRPPFNLGTQAENSLLHLTLWQSHLKENFFRSHAMLGGSFTVIDRLAREVTNLPRSRHSWRE